MTASLITPIDTLQRVELAEGVEVELCPAGPIPRALAYLIDLVIFVAVMVVVSIAFTIGGVLTGGQIGHGALLIFYFLLNWGYNVFLEAGPRGATFGKRALNLRVVADTGGPAGLSAVMLRNIVRVADALPICYFAGFIVCLFTRRFQRLGDLVANTLVVYDVSKPQTKGIRSLAGDGVREPPPVALNREERAAVVRFMERGGWWPQARAVELADHASALTGVRGVAGVSRLVRMASWLRDS